MASITVACTNCGDLIVTGDRFAVFTQSVFDADTEEQPLQVICEDCAEAVVEALADRQPEPIPFGDSPVCYRDELDEGYEGDCCPSCDDMVKD